MPSVAARASALPSARASLGLAWRLLSNAERANRPASRGASNMDRIRLFGMLAGAAVALTVSPACAQTDVKFALDWKFEGPSAPYLVAIDKGYYKAEGLNLTLHSRPRPLAGIPPLAPRTHPIAFFHTNS